MLDDWTNEGFDPFASPTETGSAFGDKHGDNRAAITRHRVTAARMVSVPGDEGLRSDDNGHPVNRQFADVGQDEPRAAIRSPASRTRSRPSTCSRTCPVRP